MKPAVDDRRQHQRYKLENSVLISSNGIYQITDLSQGGCCFRCPPYSSIAESWQTDILTPIEQLKEYPARRVWVSMSENGSHDFLPMVVGAKFGRLTKEQNTTLSKLIQIISQGNSLEQ